MNLQSQNIFIRKFNSLGWSMNRSRVQAESWTDVAEFYRLKIKESLLFIWMPDYRVFKTFAFHSFCFFDRIFEDQVDDQKKLKSW